MRGVQLPARLNPAYCQVCRMPIYSTYCQLSSYHGTLHPTELLQSDFPQKQDCLGLTELSVIPLASVDELENPNALPTKPNFSSLKNAVVLTLLPRGHLVLSDNFINLKVNLSSSLVPSPSSLHALRDKTS